MRLWNGLILCLVLVAGLGLSAGHGFAASDISLDFEGMVYATAFSERDEGWNYAYKRVVEEIMPFYPLAIESVIELSNTAEGASLGAGISGVPYQSDFVGTIDPADLVIGTSAEAPSGTPLVLVIDCTSTGFQYGGGTVVFDFSRDGTEIFSSNVPTKTGIEVFAGETLTFNFEMSNLGEAKTFALDLYISDTHAIPEPATVTILILGGTALFLRRRVK